MTTPTVTKPEGLTITPFDPPDELVATRRDLVAVGRALTTKIRNAIKAAGPSGTAAGPLMLNMVLAGETTLPQALDSIKALELTGLVRLEGVRTLVSEEIIENIDYARYDGAPTLPAGRHDRGWPKPQLVVDNTRPLAAAAAPITLSDV